MWFLSTCCVCTECWSGFLKCDDLLCDCFYYFISYKSLLMKDPLNIYFFNFNKFLPQLPFHVTEAIQIWYLKLFDNYKYRCSIYLNYTIVFICKLRILKRTDRQEKVTINMTLYSHSTPMDLLVTLNWHHLKLREVNL